MDEVQLAYLHLPPFDPGWAIRQSLVSIRDTVDVCDCITVQYWDSYESKEFVELCGKSVTLSRKIMRVQQSGSYACSDEEDVQIAVDTRLISSRVYRSNGVVECMLCHTQGKWACLPNCETGDFIEVSWISKRRPPKALSGAYWKKWPTKSNATNSRLHLSLPSDFRYHCIWDPYPSQDDQRVEFFVPRIAISTFPSWAEVSRVLSAHFKSIYNRHQPYLKDFVQSNFDFQSELFFAQLQKYIKSITGWFDFNLCVASPFKVIRECYGNRLDRELLACALIAASGRKTKFGFTSKSVKDLSIAAPWLEVPLLQWQGQWTSITSESLEVSLRGLPILECNVFEAIDVGFEISTIE